MRRALCLLIPRTLWARTSAGTVITRSRGCFIPLSKFSWAYNFADAESSNFLHKFHCRPTTVDTISANLQTRFILSLYTPCHGMGSGFLFAKLRFGENAFWELSVKALKPRGQDTKYQNVHIHFRFQRRLSHGAAFVRQTQMWLNHRSCVFDTSPLLTVTKYTQMHVVCIMLSFVVLWH